jgi:hypothetical protein
MRLWSVFRKSMREQLRELWSLALVLMLGPCFVFMYWLWFGGGSTTYSLLVINNDSGPRGAQAIAAMQNLQYSDGQSILKVIRMTDRAEAEARLKNRTSAALVILPADFSRTIQVSNTVPVVLVGDLTNPQYMVAGVIASTALGFRSQGPLWVAIFVGAVTSLSIVGIGLLLACFARTVSEAFIYANFPLILLMFFTGAMFPMPPVPLFTLGGRTIGLFDILPPTHAVVAINKVLTLGAGLSDVLYEVVMLLVLSAGYFAIGVWLFQRTHLRAG